MLWVETVGDVRKGRGLELGGGQGRRRGFPGWNGMQGREMRERKIVAGR